MLLTLHDQFESALQPLFHFKPAFDFADGIFSPLGRLLAKSETPARVEITTFAERDRSFYSGYLSSRGVKLDFTLCDDSDQTLTPAALLENFPLRLSEDLSLLSRKDFPENYPGAISLTGASSELWVSSLARISPLVAIDVTEGPVVISAGACVSSFSLLKGPLYIGENSHIDKAYLSNCRIGHTCRIGGEVANTLLGDYSNKHHEGFLGHSLVGDWVNLGALTTTSDLKNNYGEIRLEYRGKTYPTGVIKFGSIIGDFVKTGIGTMLNTGTIIDAASTLFEGRVAKKYYPPFFWGGEPVSRYQLDRFLLDMATIMKRRSQTPGNFLIEQISALHER